MSAKIKQLEAENEFLRQQVYDQALNIATLQRRITDSLDAYKKYEALYREHCYMTDRHLGPLSAYHIPIRCHIRWPANYTSYALPISTAWPPFDDLINDDGPAAQGAVLRLKQFTTKIVADASRLRRHVCFTADDAQGSGAGVVVSEDVWQAQGGKLDPRLRDYITRAIAEQLTRS